jgi:archaellin
MKQTRLTKILVAAVACAAALGMALAQTTTTTTTADPVTGTTTTASTTTTSAGTITAYTPDSDYIMFRTSAEAAPVRYYYTKDTTILDPEGHTVTWSAVRPDMPATVYYTNVGDRVVVRKVVLSQPTTIYKKEQTTTTTTKEP